MEKWEIMLKGQEKAQIQNYLHTNSYTQGFGLSLTEEDAKQLVIAHQKTFEGECCGSIEYLRGTALAKLIRKLRMEHDGIWQEEE